MASRLMLQPREGYTQPKHRPAWPPDDIERDASTRALAEAMLRLAKGMTNALEKWLEENR